MKNKKKGFTLVELLVVIAIIAILAAVVAPNAFKAIEKSKVAAAESDYKAMKTGLLSYYADTGTWPATPAVGADPGLATSSVNGPYMEKWKNKNPWGGDYSYTYDSSNGKVFITLTNLNAGIITKIESDLDAEVSDGTKANDLGIVRYDLNATAIKLMIKTP